MWFESNIIPLQAGWIWYLWYYFCSFSFSPFNFTEMVYTISDGCPAFLKSQNDARDKFADFGQPVKIWRKQWETRKHARQTGSNFLPQYASLRWFVSSTQPDSVKKHKVVLQLVHNSNLCVLKGEESPMWLIRIPHWSDAEKGGIRPCSKGTYPLSNPPDSLSPPLLAQTSSNNHCRGTQ